MTNDRTQSIGASDAPAVVCGPQFPIWAQKTGLAEPPDLDAVEAVQWGKILEATIAQTYAMRTGRTVTHNAAADVTRHPDHHFMTATLDAEQTDPKRGIGVLEIKNVGEWMVKGRSHTTGNWEDEPPLRFQVQLQHQLAVTGMSWGTLCALIGGNKLRWFDMDMNVSFMCAMIEKEAAFWELVKSKTPPPPDGSIATADTLRRMYPKGKEGEIIALPPEADDWDIARLAGLCDKVIAEVKIRTADNLLKAALGTATKGILPSGGHYTFTTTERKGYQVKPTSFRVLRRKV